MAQTMIYRKPVDGAVQTYDTPHGKVEYMLVEDGEKIPAGWTGNYAAALGLEEARKAKKAAPEAPEAAPDQPESA